MDLLVSSTDAHLLQELAAPLRRLGCTTLLKPFDLEYFLDSVAQALCNGRLSEAAMR
jgi:hypothetical protein